MNEQRILQVYDLKYGERAFYIDVEEGSELLELVADVEEGGWLRHKAWCVVVPGLPMTRRFFEFIGPGFAFYNRHDLEYVGPIIEDGHVEWCAFENMTMREEYKKKEKKDG